MPDDRLPRAFRVRAVLFILAALVVAALLVVASQFVQTLHRLDEVELERDHWQRPADIVRALAVSDGSAIADVGCGSGYFAMKLASVVGPKGQVLAVDVRRLPLAFLWVRGFLHASGNIRLVSGHTDDPRLPDGTLDAVLVANTYHELTSARSILGHLFRALRPGGRLVIVDRASRSIWVGALVSAAQEHHRSLPIQVEREVRKAGFDIVERDDRFIDQPGDDGLWWLMVARKP